MLFFIVYGIKSIQKKSKTPLKDQEHPQFPEGFSFLKNNFAYKLDIPLSGNYGI